MRHLAHLTRVRAALSIAVLVPVGLMLAGGASYALREGELPELACWILSSGQVVTYSVNGTCPLRTRDSVRAIEREGRVIPVASTSDLTDLIPANASTMRFAVSRGGEESWVSVPVVRSSRADRIARASAATMAAALMLALPLVLLWRTRSRAAPPFLLFYGAASIGMVAMVAGQQSTWMTRASIAALTLGPGALAHLALTFPRERAILSKVPALAVLPYAVSAALALMAWLVFERAPLIGPMYLSMVLVLGGATWCFLLFSCWLALRESESSVERAQARLVFWGGVLAPIGPTLLALPFAGGLASIGVVYLWSVGATMPLPIAMAIGRYNLFDLGWEARRSISRLAYLAVATLVVATILGGVLSLANGPAVIREPGQLLLLSAFAVVACETLRMWTPGLFESLVSPRIDVLLRVRTRLLDELSGLRDEDAIATALGRAIKEAIQPHRAALLLGAGATFRSAYVLGDDPPTRTDLVDEALGVLEGTTLVHLAARSDLHERTAALRMAGVEVVYSIDDRSDRHGIVLLGRSTKRPAYTGVELELTGDMVAWAAKALQRARITAALLSTERHAATGRLAVWLAHDVLKDLGWMRRLLSRLSSRVGDRERFDRDVATLMELTKDVTAEINRVVDESTGVPTPESARLDELVDVAVRRANGLHRADRVVVVLEPSVRGEVCGEVLSRAISNVIDNALHSSPDEVVRVFATIDESFIEIRVEDQGPGIPEEIRERLFEPGVTTRPEGSGFGLGLTVVREIVEELGGEIRLESGQTRGTLAVIRVPRRQGEGA